MDRRIAKRVVLAAILISTSFGAAQAGKSKFVRRLAGSKPRTVARPAIPLEWQTDLRAAHRVAEKTGRPILIVVCGPHCVPCQKLKTETLGDRTLASYINASFVPVLLDYSQKEHQRIAEILEVKVLPTCVVLSPEIDLLDSIEGFIKPAEFTRTLHLAIDQQVAQAAAAMASADVDR